MSTREDQVGLVSAAFLWPHLELGMQQEPHAHLLDEATADRWSEQKMLSLMTSHTSSLFSLSLPFPAMQEGRAHQHWGLAGRLTLHPMA